MNTEAIRAFCQHSKELIYLNEEARDRARTAQEERRAAQAVLKEVLLSGKQESIEQGYIVSSGGATYRVRTRQVKPAPPRPTSSNIEPILKLWENPVAVQSALEAFSGLEPAAALVAFLLEAVAPKIPEKEEVKWKVEVTPYKPKGNSTEDDDVPPAPPQGTNVDELVETLLRARESCQTLLKETKEARQIIEHKRDEAAEEVFPLLQALPTEKKVQKINLRDRDGNAEAFYLRVKPPLKPKPKRISVMDYKAALRTAAEDTVKRFCIDGFRLPSTASTREFGEQFCATLKETLATKEAIALEKASTSKGVKQRIALDRVRSARSTLVSSQKQSNTN